MSLPVFSGTLDGSIYTTFHLGPHPSAGGEHLYRVCEQVGNHVVAVGTVQHPASPEELTHSDHHGIVRAVAGHPQAAAA